MKAFSYDLCMNGEIGDTTGSLADHKHLEAWMNLVYSQYKLNGFSLTNNLIQAISNAFQPFKYNLFDAVK